MNKLNIGDVFIFLIDDATAPFVYNNVGVVQKFLEQGMYQVTIPQIHTHNLYTMLKTQPVKIINDTRLLKLMGMV